MNSLDTIDELIGVLGHEQRHHEVRLSDRTKDESPWEIYDWFGVSSGRLKEHDADSSTQRKLALLGREDPIFPRMDLNPLAVYDALPKIVSRRSVQDLIHGSVSNRIVAGVITYSKKDLESHGSPNSQNQNQALNPGWKAKTLHPSYNELPAGKDSQRMVHHFTDSTLRQTIYKFQENYTHETLSKPNQAKLLILVTELEERIRKEGARKNWSQDLTDAVFISTLHDIDAFDPHEFWVLQRFTPLGSHLHQLAVRLLSTPDGQTALEEMAKYPNTYFNSIDGRSRVMALINFLGLLLVEDDTTASLVTDTKVSPQNSNFLTSHIKPVIHLANLIQLTDWDSKNYDQEGFLRNTLGVIVSRRSFAYWRKNNKSKENLNILIGEVKNAFQLYRQNLPESVDLPTFNSHHRIHRAYLTGGGESDIYAAIQGGTPISVDDIRKALFSTNQEFLENLKLILIHRDEQALLKGLSDLEWEYTFKTAFKSLSNSGLETFFEENPDTADWLHDTLAQNWESLHGGDLYTTGHGLTAFLGSGEVGLAAREKITFRLEEAQKFLFSIPARNPDQRLSRIEAFYRVPSVQRLIESMSFNELASLLDDLPEIFSHDRIENRTSDAMRQKSDRLLALPAMSRFRDLFLQAVQSGKDLKTLSHMFHKIVHQSNSLYPNNLNNNPDDWKSLIGQTIPHAEWLGVVTEAYYTELEREVKQTDLPLKEAESLFFRLAELLPESPSKEKIIETYAKQLIDRMKKTIDAEQDPLDKNGAREWLANFLVACAEKELLSTSLYEHFVTTCVRSKPDYDFFRHYRDRALKNLIQNGNRRLSLLVGMDSILDASLEHTTSNALFTAMMTTTESDTALREELVTPWFTMSAARGLLYQYRIEMVDGELTVTGVGVNNFVPFNDFIHQLLGSNEFTKSLILEKLLLDVI